MDSLLPFPPEYTVSSSGAATKWIVGSAKKNKWDYIGTQQRLTE